MSVVDFVHPKTLARSANRLVALRAIIPRLQRLRHHARALRVGDIINDKTSIITSIDIDEISVSDVSIIFHDIDGGTVYRIGNKDTGKLLMSGYLMYNERPALRHIMSWKRGDWEERLF
jgi:hypothetical protein